MAGKNLSSATAGFLTKKKTMGQAVQNWEMQPQEWLPPAWPNAAATNISMPFRGNAANQIPNDAYGMYTFDPQSILLRPKAPATAQIHEYAHSAWYNDLDDFDRNRWVELHNLLRTKKKHISTKYWTGDIDYSNPVSVYPDRPGESFASAFAHYVSDPEQQKKDEPEIYNYFYKLTGGMDYSKETKK